MADLVITHRIEAPELAAALNNLADALKNREVQPVKAAPVIPFPVQTPVVEAPAVNPTQADASATSNVSGATPVTTNAPTVAAPTPVPVSDPAPVSAATSNPLPVADKPITYDDIVNAGGQLLEIDAREKSNEKMTQLMELLKSFGVQAITQLKPEQYADVAAGLRRLGANI